MTRTRHPSAWGLRRWALVLGGVLVLGAVCCVAPFLLAGTRAARTRVENSLESLLSAKVHIDRCSLERPWDLRLEGVSVSRGGTPIATVPVVCATLAPTSLFSRLPRLTGVRLVNARFDAAGLDCLASLVGQPEDRLPARIGLERGDASFRLGQRELALRGLSLEVVSQPGGRRSLTAEGRADQQSWSLTGVLRPMGAGALHLRLTGAHSGSFEIPVAFPRGHLVVGGSATLELEGRIEDRHLRGYTVRVEAPRLVVALPRLEEPIEARNVILTADDHHSRLEGTTVMVGETAFSVQAGADRLRPGEVTLECGRFGPDFPRAPASGEPSLAMTWTVAGPLSAPRLSGLVRAVPGVAPPGGGQFEARLAADLDIMDLKLQRLKISGAVDGRPYSFTGSVAIPPWEPSNPVVSLTADLPWLPARLVPAFAGWPGSQTAALAFKGTVRGSRRWLQPNGEVRLASGPLGGLAAFEASVRTKPESRKAIPEPQVISCTCQTVDGLRWVAAGPFGVAYSGGALRFATPASFRAGLGPAKQFIPGDPFPGGR